MIFASSQTAPQTSTTTTRNTSPSIRCSVIFQRSFVGRSGSESV
jgi:hypothetical protein